MTTTTRKKVVKLATIILLIIAIPMLAGSRLMTDYINRVNKKVDAAQTVIESNADTIKTLKDTIRRIRNETISRRVAECHSTNSFRADFRKVLDQIAHPPAGKPFDVSSVPGFVDLPSGTQTYLISLAKRISSNTSNITIAAILDDYKKTHPIIDCVTLRHELEKKLK